MNSARSLFTSASQSEDKIAAGPAFSETSRIVYIFAVNSPRLRPMNRAKPVKGDFFMSIESVSSALQSSRTSMTGAAAKSSAAASSSSSSDSSEELIELENEEKELEAQIRQLENSGGSADEIAKLEKSLSSVQQQIQRLSAGSSSSGVGALLDTQA